MADDYKFYCICCHRRFIHELRPVLGFATARACEICQAEFARQWAENVKENEREYEQRR